MPHTHVIDGKVVSFDNANCPYCRPEIVKQQYTEQQEQLPRTYIKGVTCVLKISKATMITVTYWADKQVFLVTFQRMLRTAQGEPIRDEKGDPRWTKLTTRLTTTMLQEWIHTMSELHQSLVQQQIPAPRD